MDGLRQGSPVCDRLGFSQHMSRLNSMEHTRWGDGLSSEEGELVVTPESRMWRTQVTEVDEGGEVAIGSRTSPQLNFCKETLKSINCSFRRVCSWC